MIVRERRRISLAAANGESRRRLTQHSSVASDLISCLPAEVEVSLLSKRILVVDDAFGDRMVLRDYLLSFGYQIAGEAKCGRESLEKYRDLKPDLVLLDAAMPDMDGVSVVRELLRQDGEANILICVSRGQRALAIEAVHAGASDFVTKPISPRRLKKAIHGLIG